MQHQQFGAGQLRQLHRLRQNRLAIRLVQRALPHDDDAGLAVGSGPFGLAPPAPPAPRGRCRHAHSHRSDRPPRPISATVAPCSPGLADAGVQDRRLEARVGADQQDRLRRCRYPRSAPCRHRPNGCPRAASRRPCGIRPCRPALRSACFSAKAASTGTRSPTRPATVLPFIAAAAAASASGQLTGSACRPRAHRAVSSRWRRSPSQTKRVLSEIHSSFTPSWLRGRMRMTSRPLVSTRMFDPSASITSIVSVFVNSHGRAVKA